MGQLSPLLTDCYPIVVRIGAEAATTGVIWWCGAGDVSYFDCEAYSDQCSFSWRPIV
jgi:hypothetical protein